MIIRYFEVSRGFFFLICEGFIRVKITEEASELLNSVHVNSLAAKAITREQAAQQKSPPRRITPQPGLPPFVSEIASLGRCSQGRAWWGEPFEVYTIGPSSAGPLCRGTTCSPARVVAFPGACRETRLSIILSREWVLFVLRWACASSYLYTRKIVKLSQFLQHTTAAVVWVNGCESPRRISEVEVAFVTWMCARR